MNDDEGVNNSLDSSFRKSGLKSLSLQRDMVSKIFGKNTKVKQMLGQYFK